MELWQQQQQQHSNKAFHMELVDIVGFNVDAFVSQVFNKTCSHSCMRCWDALFCFVNNNDSKNSNNNASHDVWYISANNKPNIISEIAATTAAALGPVIQLVHALVKWQHF